MIGIHNSAFICLLVQSSHICRAALHAGIIEPSKVQRISFYKIFDSTSIKKLFGSMSNRVISKNVEASWVVIEYLDLRFSGLKFIILLRFGNIYQFDSAPYKSGHNLMNISINLFINIFSIQEKKWQTYFWYIILTRKNMLNMIIYCGWLVYMKIKQKSLLLISTIGRWKL